MIKFSSVAFSSTSGILDVVLIERLGYDYLDKPQCFDFGLFCTQEILSRSLVKM